MECMTVYVESFDNFHFVEVFAETGWDERDDRMKPSYHSGGRYIHLEVAGIL